MSGSVADLLAYLDSSPTPFHLVDTTQQRLLAAGFTKLEERETWLNKIQKGGKYFFNRSGTSVVAFTVGGAYQPGNQFQVIGAHSDSPTLKVRPISQRSGSGYLQVGVECYAFRGYGLYHTWFDRDLSLAGCVVVEEADGRFAKRLVHIKRPLLRIPNLCVHLQTAEEKRAFQFNEENQLQPIFSLVEAELNKAGDKGPHSPHLLSLLAEELGCTVEAIRDMELTLFDTQGGSVWGLNEEFLSSARLDNQVHCYTGLCALLQHAAAIEKDSSVSMLICYDHEEVGSRSAQGAGGPLLSDAIARVLACFTSQAQEELYMITIRNSFLLSADVEHAIHPNYPEKHEKNHAPVLNKGTVIKTNHSQSYATNLETGFLLRELSRRAGVPTQEFAIRNDIPCGITIGPIVSARVGIRTGDLGISCLSMHSVRETVGCEDIANNIRILTTFYSEFGHLDRACSF